MAEHAGSWSTVSHPDNPAPLERCSCGIYAVARAEDLDFLPQAGRDGGFWAVWGLVRLWGKVIKHAKGYRAQNAEVAALVGSTLVDVERIAELYGAPVITEEEWYGVAACATDVER